jgi:hypothetical protein
MKKKTILILFATTVFVIFLIYWGYDRWPTQNWREYRSLVRIWPRLKKEKIESIGFYDAPYSEIAKGAEGTFFSFFKNEIIETYGLRTRDENDVKSWHIAFEIPKENLQECIKIIDKAMKGAEPSWPFFGPAMHLIWQERMLIVTDKGKYIVKHIDTYITKVDSPRVFGDEWSSYELGKFLAKHCFPDIEYKYSFPSKEQVVAILLYPPKFSPPLAIFGDKKLAEELLFKTESPDDPNGIQGIGGLYKFTRLRKFGVETKIEGREIIIDNELKPKMVFEGRDWLEKVMDAYEVAFKKAEEKEKYYPGGPDPFNARIVFMTRDKDYWKEIGIDENMVYDDYIKSEQLEKYFDELGLTRELLTK